MTRLLIALSPLVIAVWVLAAIGFGRITGLF